MRKFGYALMLSIVLPLIAPAQPLSSVIKAQAMEMSKAMVAGDVQGFSRFMHPAVVEKAGGAEKLQAMADTMTRVFRQFGGSVTRILVGNPGPIVQHKKTLQATLSQTTFVKTVFADIEAERILIALSSDGGKRWYFLDPDLYKNPEMKAALPALSPELVIPAAVKPKIIPKNPPDGEGSAR
jgi:hypothetical protein